MYQQLSTLRDSISLIDEQPYCVLTQGSLQWVIEAEIRKGEAQLANSLRGLR